MSLIVFRSLSLISLEVLNFENNMWFNFNHLKKKNKKQKGHTKYILRCHYHQMSHWYVAQTSLIMVLTLSCHSQCPACHLFPSFDLSRFCLSYENMLFSIFHVVLSFNFSSHHDFLKPAFFVQMPEEYRTSFLCSLWSKFGLDQLLKEILDLLPCFSKIYSEAAYRPTFLQSLLISRFIIFCPTLPRLIMHCLMLGPISSFLSSSSFFKKSTFTLWVLTSSQINIILIL